MEKKLGQEPAYPSKHYDINGRMDRQYNGMSKRFYAACAAMQGLLAIPHPNNDKTIREIAEESFMIADELLKQENE